MVQLLVVCSPQHHLTNQRVRHRDACKNAVVYNEGVTPSAPTMYNLARAWISTEATDIADGILANYFHSAGGRAQAMSTSAKQEASKVEEKVASIADQAKDAVKGS